MTDPSDSAYQRLETLFDELSVLGDVIGMLDWDAATLMPPGGVAARSGQLAMLRRMRHERLTDAAMAPLLDEAEAGADTLTRWQAANLREMRRRWAHAAGVPADLVAAGSRARAACEAVWRTARRDDSFESVRPALEEVIGLVRQVAAAKASVLDCSPYDALLDTYEPGADSAALETVFADYAVFLPDFLEDVLARQDARPAPAPPAGPFPVEAQHRLARRMAEAVGLDFESARLDESAHPFSGGVPEDSRITTRYNPDNYAEGLMAVLHESGHAMYERGLPEEWRRQPVGDARGMAVHESQSLLVEMQMSRSAAFYAWAAPVMREAFGGNGPAWEPENLHRLAIRVERSLIRVDADEVTYPAHVILRYRLEKALLADDLPVRDLPGAWRDGMRELLGTAPPNDRDGCLQDIHWYDGILGYFPTYTLGAFAAAQIFAAALEAEPDIPASVARGDFVPLMAWLRTNVHEQASLMSTDDLLTQVTGRPLGPEAFKAHLKARYLA
jgi:carboxypeptidase Taq